MTDTVSSTSSSTPKKPKVYTDEQRIRAARAAVKLSGFTGKPVPQRVVNLSKREIPSNNS